MTSNDFVELVRDIIRKRKMRNDKIKKRLTLGGAAWLLMLAFVEICIWAKDGSQWWAVPLGITFFVAMVIFIIFLIHSLIIED